jgi:predicted alpha-1,2-mannosidase
MGEVVSYTPGTVRRALLPCSPTRPALHALCAPRSPRAARASRSLLALLAAAAAASAGLGCSSKEADPEPTQQPAAQQPVEQFPPGKPPLELASPFVGTGGFAFSFGSSSVGAMSPQGLAKVGPDTKGSWGDINFLHYSGYWFDDDTIEGFSHLHLHGTGATDYGVLAVMPTDGIDKARTTRAGYGSPFHKETEAASPGFYGVTLDRGAIAVELTATEHAAHHRYTFPDGAGGAAQPTLVFDLTHRLSGGRVTSAEAHLSQADGRVSGKLHSLGGMSGGFGGYDVYFEGKISTPWASQAVWKDGGEPADGVDVVWAEPDGGDQKSAPVPVGFSLSFARPLAGPVELVLGLSLVSAEGAAANLAAEIPAGQGFDDTHKGAAAAWDGLLGTIKVSGGTELDQRTFYSALYHAFVMPSRVGDADGKYVPRNGLPTRQAEGFRYVSDMSLWDTYRTLHPLYALIAPDRALDAVRSLHEMAISFGAFPKWPIATGESGTMIGASAEIVLADAYVKGVTDFDAKGAYAIMRAAAMDPTAPPGGRGGRDNVESYMKYGYVTADHGGSVSKTGEYAWNDFALSNLARALGETADADALLARSKGYKGLFDPDSGFLRGKHEDGSWSAKAIAPTIQGDDFVEANAWQTLWAPMHDVDGMIGLFGSRQAFIDKLSEFFDKGRADFEETPLSPDLKGSGIRPYFWPANEPDIHAEYMFAQAGRPDLTQKWVRWIDETFFKATPDGIPGNDDGGTMSSWFIFNTLGFYPLAGSDIYVVGAPHFPMATIAVPGGSFVVEGKGVSKENLYVQSVTLNGAPLAVPQLRHADLRPGGSLVFEMGPAPSTWGQAQ